MEKKTIFLVYSYFKGRVRDFWQPMLIFESPKQTRPCPKGSRPYFDISAVHIRTQPRKRLCNPMLLTYREETMQPLHLIAGLPAPLVSLQHWKADPIFTLLTLSQHSPNPVLAPLALQYFLWISYHVSRLLLFDRKCPKKWTSLDIPP